VRWRGSLSGKVWHSFNRGLAQGHVEISGNIRKINDLRELFLNFQEIEHATANGREWTRILCNLIAWERDRPGRRRVRLAPDSCSKERNPDMFGEAPNTATGTVALPKIRVHSRPFAVEIGFLRNPLSHNAIDTLLYSHDENPTRSAKNQKTYRRLFGMIFFGGLDSLLIPCLQRLATRNFLKNRKNSKANSIFMARNIDLAAKTAQKRPVFSVSTR
jgi:hypothetical protein